MTDARTQAIESFDEMTSLDKKAMSILSTVLGRHPNAILIAWEENGEVKATSVPFSACLVKGMVDTLFDMVFGDKDYDESSEDGEE
jgi:hypothetical protein